jgi:hypothetical protein
LAQDERDQGAYNANSRLHLRRRPRRYRREGGNVSGPIEDRYRAQMNALAAVLDDELNDKDTPRKTGFVLLLFDFGEPKAASRMNYISNAERADMLVALHELLANFEGRMMPDAKGQ